jgi:transposase InsO family protein
MEYPGSAWERAMRLQEVMLKAISGELHWFRAAEILGMSPRGLRRWRERYERYGYDGLLDRRCGKPCVRRVPVTTVEQILRLYRERYRGFNVRHFHQMIRRAHGVTVSYSFVKQALQVAGLVKKRRPRGRHRRRREPRACFGELLHLDGSVHPWLALAPDLRPCLIAIPDDATNQVLHAALYPSESTEAVMRALGSVFRRYGLPMALYTDRAKWAFHTPKAKGPVDKTQLTQVGRALARLGIEHIPAYSPQARGRSERLNRTLQDRLVNELRVAGVTTLEGANAYLRKQFVPQHNATFARPPRDPASAFVPLGTVDLEAILCHETERAVARDNTVTVTGCTLQIAPQPGRRSCAGLMVTVRRHLDGRFTILRGTQCFGRFRADGRPMEGAGTVAAKTAPTVPWKTPRTRFPQGPQAGSSV